MADPEPQLASQQPPVEGAVEDGAVAFAGGGAAAEILVEALSDQGQCCQHRPGRSAPAPASGAAAGGLVVADPCRSTAVVRVSWGNQGERQQLLLCLRHSQAKVAQLRRRPIAEVHPLAPSPPAQLETALSQAATLALLPPERNPAFVYLARLASGSRRTMREALDEMARAVWGKGADAARVPWHRLTYAHTSTLRTLLAEGGAPSTANKKLAALRGVLREAWKLGLLATDDYQKAVAVEGVKDDHLPVGRALSKDQVASLFDACAKDATIWGRRDAALLALLFGVGLRRAEACALTLADYDPQQGEVVVRRGKGAKDRRNWLPAPGRAAIEEWLGASGAAAFAEGGAAAARGREPGFLLAAVNPLGRPRPARRMSTEAVYRRLQVLADRAGVPRFSPHDARRTYLTHAIGDGEDLVTVMKLAGHARITTTVRYDRRGDLALQEAAARRFLPFAAAPPSPAAAALPSATAASPSAEPAAPVLGAGVTSTGASTAATSPPTTDLVPTVHAAAEASKTEKKRRRARKKAPRIAAAAPSRAGTTLRTRKAKSARPVESRPKPGKAQRLRGRQRRFTMRKA